MTPHAPSYYAATANPAPDRPPLQGNHRADVAVIGAGFTGISAALELAERGASVIVLEAAQVGWGASGRNGGQMLNGYSRELDVIARRYGAQAAEDLGAMALEGGQIIRDRVAKYAIGCALTPGNVITAFTHRQLRGLDHARQVWTRYGHTAMQLIDRDGLAPIVASDRYVGGLYDPLGGHVHPLNLVLGQAAAFESLGGRIHEHSRVTDVDTGPAPSVTTAQGRVDASHILVCGNAYLSPLLHTEIGTKIMPVSSQVMATEPMDPARLAALLPANYCIEDANYFLDYFRRTPDHRLIYGGGTVYGGADPASIEGKLRPLMLKTFRPWRTFAPNMHGAAISPSRCPASPMWAASHPPPSSAMATAATASPPLTCSAAFWPKPPPATPPASTPSRTCRICHSRVAAPSAFR